MSEAYKRIRAGLEDAIAHVRGDDGAAVVHRPREIDVKSIRQRSGMSQQGFCAAFGISLGTLRHWEQGLREPRGPARTLLMVVDQDPMAVIRAIHGDRGS